MFAGASDQVGAERQHQHTCAVLNQLGDGGHLKAHHHFERGHDQGNDDHLGELLFQTIEVLDVQQVAS